MSKRIWLCGIAALMLAAPAVRADEEGKPNEAKKVENPKVAVAMVKLSPYWLGIACRPADDTLRSQLQVPEGRGLVVDNVMPESPAAKAKIQVHDVLLAAGEQELTDLADLVGAVDEAKETELSIELIRGGKRQTVKVTPGKRPEKVSAVELPKPGDWKQLEQWIGPAAPQIGKGPAQLRFFHPGALVPKGNIEIRTKLPGDMTISITRQGDKPAEIKVTRGEESWEVTEKELDKLPGDVRPHVERMLGRITAGVKVGHGVRTIEGVIDMVPKLDAPQRAMPPIERKQKDIHEKIQQRMQKQIEEMNRQMEELRKSVEQLQEES